MNFVSNRMIDNTPESNLARLVQEARRSRHVSSYPSPPFMKIDPDKALRDFQRRKEEERMAELEKRRRKEKEKRLREEKNREEKKWRVTGKTGLWIG